MREKVLLVAAFILVSLVGRPPALSAGSSAHGSLSAETTEPASPPTSGVPVFPARGKSRLTHERLMTKAAPTPPLLYHGGPVIASAHVVYIFWGPSFNNIASPDYSYAQTLQSFRNQLGTAPEYATITQYSGIGLTNLGAGTADWFDVSTPPTNVTDAIAQGEVNTYLATHTFDASAIYEVVLPSASYSSMSSTSTSCGGPALSFCAYHGFFTSGSNVVKYSVQPYASCGGCQTGGWTAVQNQEHFVTHETREAVTDPQLNAWTDIAGYEADDECAWSPTPFFGTGGYGYQAEWSNALNACTASTPNPNHEGYHEVANCRGISGWAWDQTQPNTPINVDIDRDSSLIANVPANLFRSDLLSAGKGNGSHAFVYTPDASWKDAQWHSARVRYGGSSASLYWSPISFICNVSIFTTQVPTDDLSTGGQVYTVATQFSSSQSGYITQLGFYRAVGETGTNTLRLWTDGGAQLASVPASCGGSGWCWASISPVAITANTLYRVSVNTNTFQAKTGCGIGSGITNQVLTAQQGFWIAGDTFPTTSSCSNFFVDVKFDM
jgi:Domain of unknown function (DUF4082)